MTISRLAAASLAALCLTASGSVLSQAYPAKPIRWVVPLPAGGGMDIMTRATSQRLQSALGQNIVVDNRPGAAGIIGAENVAKSPADGYTLLSADNGIITMNPFAYRKLPYDPVKDFQPVSTFAKVPFVLFVNPSVVNVNDARELFAYARANPGKVNYASFGPGSISHVWTELLAQRADIKLTHVPYKGAAPGLQDLAGGQVAMMLVDYGAARGFVTQGKIKPLAVTTRVAHPRLPGVPTMESVGVKDYDIYGWVGMMAPAGTPRAVVARLHDELEKAAPEVSKQFTDLGIGFETRTPEQFAEMIRQDLERWGPVMKALNIQLD